MELVSRTCKHGFCKFCSIRFSSIFFALLSFWIRSQLQNDLMQKWDLPEARRPYDDFLDSDSDGENDANDMPEDEEEIDNGEITLTIALQVRTLKFYNDFFLCWLQIIDRFGGKQSTPNLPMDDLMKTLFRDAVDYIGRFISERGMQGECLFAKQEGYEILFAPMNKHMITDFKVCALPFPLNFLRSLMLGSQPSRALA